MVISINTAKEEVCPLKMKDSLADPDRIVERSDQGMCGLLVLKEVLIVCPGH